MIKGNKSKLECKETKILMDYESLLSVGYDYAEKTLVAYNFSGDNQVSLIMWRHAEKSQHLNTRSNEFKQKTLGC